MMGHTDTKTINQRRPLTDGMIYLLRELFYFNQASRRYQAHIPNGREKNILRALIARGLVNWHIETRSYSLTVAGRKEMTDRGVK